MTETAPDEQKQSKRNLEIIHCPHRDIIVNRDSDLAVYGHQLADLFKDGTPVDWEKLGPTDSEIKEMDDDPGHPAYLRPKTGSARGTVEGIEFFVKPKYAGDRNRYYRRKELAHAPGNPDPKGSLKMARLFNSVLNELSLSPKVKSITASPEAQALAMKYGRVGIKFVEPVIAVIDRQTGDKSIVYEYIKSAVNLASFMESENGPQYEQFAAEFDELLWENGIDSNDHAGELQFMLDDNGYVYQIDSESYSAVEKRE